MSWLFPALIPALLMLATFGLERLESALATDDLTDEIDKLVAESPSKADRAAPPPARTPSWAGPAPANGHRPGTFTGLATLVDEPGLPTRVCRRETANPQFQPTRHANPV